MIEFMAGKVAGDATVNKGRDGPHPAPEADVLLELGVGFDTVVDTWGTQAASARMSVNAITVLTPGARFMCQ